MSQHTVNGYFAGAGILQLFYESSSEKSALWVPEQVIPPNLDMLTVANGDTPFEESIDLIANEFIRWYARNVHATNSITGLYGNFVQKGRTS